MMPQSKTVVRQPVTKGEQYAGPTFHSVSRVRQGGLARWGTCFANPWLELLVVSAVARYFSAR